VKKARKNLYTKTTKWQIIRRRERIICGISIEMEFGEFLLSSRDWSFSCYWCWSGAVAEISLPCSAHVLPIGKSNTTRVTILSDEFSADNPSAINTTDWSTRKEG